jgi:POT family proton-dependent oligopeptide transporter
MVAYRTAPDPQETGWPKGIPYIIGNEGCERFGFYGMRAILFVYISYLLRNSGVTEELSERHATEVVHTFFAGVYALPMVGAVIADRWWGKYPTIIWLSLVYCAGHACLALFDGNFKGSIVGLVLIAVGSGGIKPCVSAHVGDQFGEGNFSKVERVYQAFYFIINFGSFFSTLLIPWTKGVWGFGVAFGIPGILMGIATICFWMGRHVFVHVPPKPGGKLGLIDVISGILLFLTIAFPMFGAGLLPPYAALSLAGKLLLSVACFGAGMAVFSWRQTLSPDDGFLAVLVYALRAKLTGHALAPLPAAQGPGEPGELARHPFWGSAVKRFGLEAAEGPPAVLRIITVFLMVSMFWALFDQHASSWIAQAREMDRSFELFGKRFELLPEQISAANPLLVMLLVPLMGYVVYPAVAKLLRREFTLLQRMTVGMSLTAFAFVIVALAQERLDAGGHVHIAVQLLAYLVLTTSEVMVSVTGLEFAYTQAPRRMKALLMGFWLLAVSLGNLLVALLSELGNLPRAQFFWTFAGLMLVASVLFGVRAAFYRYKTYVQ